MVMMTTDTLKCCKDYTTKKKCSFDNIRNQHKQKNEKMNLKWNKDTKKD